MSPEIVGNERNIAPAQEELESLQAKEYFAANLDTIINATGIGLWDWNLATGKIVHSGQLERLAGYDDGEMPTSDQTARDILIYPLDRKRADDVIAACVRGDIQSYETEFRILCKNGDIKWIQDRGAVAQRDEKGNATRIVGMFYDVNRFKKTEESLAQKVRLLDFVAELSGLGTMELNLETGLIAFDDDFLRMLGYTQDEVAKDFAALEDFIYADDYPIFVDSVADYLKGISNEDIYSQQLRALHKNGKYVWIMITARVAEWTDDERPKQVYAGILNVDKLVRAELEVQKTLLENERHKEKLQREMDSAVRDLEEARRTSMAMFEANPFMCLLLDDKLQVADCNPALMEYMGYATKQEAIANVLPHFVKAIPPYQPNGKVSLSLDDRIKTTMREGFVDFETYFDFNGELVAMNIFMKKITYRDTFAIVIYQFDLTRIKQTENELLNQDRLLKTANSVASLLMQGGNEDFLEALNASLAMLGKNLGVDRAYVWRNTLEGEVLYAEQLCEWIDEQGRGYLEYGERKFSYDELIPNWQEILANFSAGNPSINSLDDVLANFPGLSDVKSVLLIPIIIKNVFWGFLGFDDCLRSGRVFSESEERIMLSAGILIAAADIRNNMTENLIAAKEAALEGSRAKSNFLSRMSHEIRTPMNAIIGMTAIAQKEEDMQKVKYCLDKIDTASRQLLGLINDVLDMSKIEANKLEMSLHEFDFEKMIQGVFHLVNVKMEEKKLDLNFHFKDMFTHRIISDELRLSQVLINLLNNAAKFTPENGHINVRISTIEKGGGKATLHVVVQDDGIGISREQQERLFKAFEQADGSITRKYGGTGLGLTICRNILRLLGGDIWVESEPSNGTCFIFEVDFAWGAPIVEGLSLCAIKENRQILVVDDCQESRDYFQNILSGFAMVCHTASGGKEAVDMVKSALARQEPYGIIFIDWIMPEMSGKETAAAIKGLIGDESTIVMISVADRADVEQDISHLGTNHFLAKPVLPSTLYNTVISINSKISVSKEERVDGKVYTWPNKKILVVEDIEINREIIINILEETGLTIDVGCDGLEAVNIFKKQGYIYDLILMDVQMPNLDGLGATKHIRASGWRKCRDIPIIAMTANAFKEDVDKCLQAGMNGHIAKPINISSLFPTLAMYLD